MPIEGGFRKSESQSDVDAAQNIVRIFFDALEKYPSGTTIGDWLIAEDGEGNKGFIGTHTSVLVSAHAVMEVIPRDGILVVRTLMLYQDVKEVRFALPPNKGKATSLRPENAEQIPEILDILGAQLILNCLRQDLIQYSLGEEPITSAQIAAQTGVEMALLEKEQSKRKRKKKN